MDPKGVSRQQPSSGLANFYDLVAPIYDRHWGRAFFASAARLFQRYAAPRLSPGARVLDLCCGSGRFAAYLTRAGYRVTGVDLSRSLLAEAAVRAPSAFFVTADMASFALPETFDAAVCWFNSLNHARDENHLTAIMCRLARHLAPSAPFLFDVIPEDDYRCSWKNEECVLSAEGYYQLAYTYHAEEHRATCHVRVRSRQDPTHIQAEAVSEQRPMELAAIGRALQRAGFRLIGEKPLDGGHPPHGRHLILAERNAPTL